MRFGKNPGLTSRLVCYVLAVSMSLGVPGPGLLEAGAAAPVATTGSLSIETDPAGATVLVDGQSLGVTPLAVKAIAPGDHRVRVVKDGYLDNSRLVTVQPGQAGRVQVRLTPDGKASAVREQRDPATPQPSPSPSGGSSKKKWALIGLGAAAVGTAVYIVATGNSAPTAGTIGASPTGTGMAGITSYTFTAQGATDPDNDPLTFEWNFGDGQTGSGQTASHVYAAAGSFTVALTVKDKKHTVTAPSATVTVARSMAGTWTGATEPGFGATVSVTLTQSGTTLGGSMTFAGGISGTLPGLTGTLSGTSYPVTVNFTTPQFTLSGLPGTFAVRFSGPTDAAGNTMTGTITSTSTALQPPTLTATTTFRR